MTEPHKASETDQSNDLYYDDTADAEWDGSEYEEVIDGDQGADTTIDTEADGEYEYTSAQSSITLWSRHSKRSIHDLDEDEDDKSKGLVSVQSSPGKLLCIYYFIRISSCDFCF